MELIALFGETPRSRAYLQGMCQSGFIPKKLIILSAEEDLESESLGEMKECPLTEIQFNPKQSLAFTSNEFKIPFEIVTTLDPNDKSVEEALKLETISTVIYSPPRNSGFSSILKTHILNTDKKFIHVHPGITPQYKGSTVMYYSLLFDGKVGASVFCLEEGLDEGEPLHQIELEVKDYKLNFDDIGDSTIRSLALIQYLKGQRVRFIKDSEEQVFHVIHPVLKHLALNKIYE
jgi:methionyl-tRNA formyltransferase